MAKKLKVGDPVKLDGRDGTVGAIGDPLARLDLPAPGDKTHRVDCTAAELCWADEGFWYLPQRVGEHLPQELRERVMTHPKWLAGRDDLALQSIRDSLRG